MSLWRCTVYRKMKWTVEIEADNEEEAKDTADDYVRDFPPDDDWAYETTAVEIE